MSATASSSAAVFVHAKLPQCRDSSVRSTRADFAPLLPENANSARLFPHPPLSFHDRERICCAQVDDASASFLARDCLGGRAGRFRGVLGFGHADQQPVRASGVAKRACDGWASSTCRRTQARVRPMPRADWGCGRRGQASALRRVPRNAKSASPRRAAGQQALWQRHESRLHALPRIFAYESRRPGRATGRQRPVAR